MTTIIEDVKLDFSDVLLMPKRSSLDSRSKVDITRTFKFKHSPVEYTGTPIIAANMDVTGTIAMAKAFKSYNMSVALHKFYSVETLFNYFSSADRNPHTFYTMGITDGDYEKFKKVELNTRIAGHYIDYICIDVANGYSRKFVSFVEKIRQEFPRSVIMAGNVVTPDMVYDLVERGVDIVKVGIGPGSVCTTRRITGVGYPQLSAIMECTDAAHGSGGLICGDGGVVVPGDVSKAFAAGSDFVMCGGLFAGHEECEGEMVGVTYSLKQNIKWNPKRYGLDCVDIVEIEGEQHEVNNTDFSNFLTTLKLASERGSSQRKALGSYLPKYEWALEIHPEARMRFYGMSSHDAMDKHYGGKANYRASEGKAVEIPFKGPVKLTVEEMLGGLRSCSTYIGARRLKDMPKCATFIRVNRILNNSLSKYDAS